MSIPNGQVMLPTPAFSVPAGGAWYSTYTGFGTTFQVALPGPGTYLINANLRTKLNVFNGPGVLMASFFDYVGTNNPFPSALSPVPNSTRIIRLDPTGSGLEDQRTTAMQFIYTTAASAPVLTLALYRVDGVGAVWNFCQVLSDVSGCSNITYLQL